MSGHVGLIGWIRSGSCREDRGFTVVELLVSIMIMTVVAMGTLTALTFAASSTRASSIRDGALDLANKQLEYARNVPYLSLGTVGPGGQYGDPPGVILTPDTTTTPQATYNLATEVTWIRDTNTGRAQFKRVRVTVSWFVNVPGTGTGTTSSVSVSTDVFGNQAGLVNTGDLEITTLKKDDNSPLQFTQVTITPSSGSARTVWTDAQGKAFFGFVPAGAVGIAISNGSYLFDPTQYTGSSINVDLLNKITVYGQVPSAADVTVVGNPSGTPIAGATVRLTDTQSHWVQNTTDASGLAHFDNLLIGTYTMNVSASGRTSVTNQTLSVTAGGQTVAKTVQMTDPATLLVRVQDQNAARLAGATVTVTGPSPSTSNITGSPGTTAANGEISFANVLNGQYSVLVHLTAYADQTIPITVVGSPVTQVVTLAHASGPGSLLVTVKDSLGTPVYNARVRFWTGATYVSYRTDANGQVSLTGIAPGSNYGVTWRNSSSQWSNPIPVTISPGQQTQINVTYQ